MKFQNRRLTALAAVTLVASLGLTACGSDDDSGDDSGGGGGGGDVAITMLPKNLGNPYFDTSTAGAEKAAERDRRPRSRRSAPTPPRPDAQVPFINTAAQQGVGALDRVGQRPRGALRRARRGPRRRRQGRDVRLRHRPRVPRPVHQPGHGRGHRQGAGRPDRRADRRRGRDRDPLGGGQRHQPERLDRDDGDGARRRTTPTSSSSTRSTATTTTRRRSTRPRRCCRPTRTSRASSRRPRSASRPPPATCRPRTRRARSR